MRSAKSNIELYEEEVGQEEKMSMISPDKYEMEAPFRAKPSGLVTSSSLAGECNKIEYDEVKKNTIFQKKREKTHNKKNYQFIEEDFDNTVGNSYCK